MTGVTESCVVGRVPARLYAGPFDVGTAEPAVSDLVADGWTVVSDDGGVVRLTRPLTLWRVINADGICCPACSRPAWRSGRCEADDWRATAPCLHRCDRDTARAHHISILRALLAATPDRAPS